MLMVNDGVAVTDGRWCALEKGLEAVVLGGMVEH